MIRLEQVKREFGGHVLFDGVDWLVPASARIGLVGPNGSGKTTILRLLSGESDPDAGAVHRPVALRIAYLPQEVETVEQGTVLEVALGGGHEAARLQSELEALGGRLGRVAEHAELQRLTERYGALRLRFEQLDGDRLEARARAILSGLGVAEQRFDAPIDRLSGGWRMRVVLARLLLSVPDLLLLDEPTNHLDLEALDWLESFLESFQGAFVVVSHDRYFLNRIVRDVVELRAGRLTRYAGNYDAYVEAKQTRRESDLRRARQQARERQQTERFIERFRYKNTKARQVQSRIRAMGKVDSVQIERQAPTVRFGFPPAPRSGDIAVRAESVSKRFGDTVVYDGMDLLLRRGDRVALVGPNGAGKSTLLKMLADRLQPDSGRLELGHNVSVHYFAQHQLDELDPAATLLEEMQRASPGSEPVHLRKLLGRFLFTGGDVDKRVRVLSGGEKARLALAQMLVRAANLLLLDEPTNHLDLDSREVLDLALGEYTGTLVVISHDRYFINRAVNRIGTVADGKVDMYDGSYDEYAEARRRHAADAETTQPDGERQRSSKREQKRLEAEQRNRRYRERQQAEQRLLPLERQIETLESRRTELEREQGDPGVYADPERAAETARDKADVERQLDDLYRTWEAAARDLEDDPVDPVC